MSQKKSKGWPVVGTIRKGEKGSYIKFADNVTILVDGQPLEMNKSRTANLQSPVDNLERKINAGLVEESQVETEREKVQAINAWLKYEIVVPPAQKG